MVPHNLSIIKNVVFDKLTEINTAYSSDNLHNSYTSMLVCQETNFIKIILENKRYCFQKLRKKSQSSMYLLVVYFNIWILWIYENGT